jgi:aminoglycoside phosphotransferase (APT) family kinase protein
MALLNKLDAPTTTAQLTDWLAGKLPRAEDIRVTELDIPQAAGMSMTTILFKVAFTEDGAAHDLDLVARVAPAAPGVFKDPDLRREYEVLSALAGGPVQVPTVRWVEEDPAVLGSPFMVMDRAYGRVPADDPPYVVEGWVLDLPPAERGKLYDQAVKVVAAMHSLDWQALGLDFLDEARFGPLGIEQQIAHWEDVYEWAADGQPSPTIDAALAWAKANKPAGEELVLNWGDARIGNIIYGGDLSVEAVLDWEMATIASPEMDLGWLVFFVRYYSDGIGMAIPEGLPTRDDLVARYSELTGREVQNLEYYEAFAALRLSILMCRAGHLMIAAGALPPDNPMPVSNPASQLLATLLGLPAPDGAAVNFVGNR